MKKEKKNNIFLAPVTFVIFDSIMIFAGFIFSFWLRFESGLIPVTKGVPPYSMYLRAFIIVWFVWLIVFQFCNLYDRRLRYSRIDEAYSLLIATAIGTILIMAFTFWYREFTYSRVMIIIAWIVIYIFLIITRFILRKLSIILFKKGYGTRRLAIFGLNRESFDLKKKIIKNPNLGYRVMGFILDSDPPAEFEEESVLGKLEDYKNILKENKISAILWVIEDYPHARLVEILDYCERLGCEIKIVSDIFGIITTRVQVENIDGIPTVSVKKFRLTGINLLIKRFFDILFSLLVMLVFAIPYLVIAILIKLSSKGPVLFKQVRVTRNEKEFTMLKFRTMVPDAEEDTGPVWTKKDDERITGIGKILRKTSLDEMPQFFNVLIGDMSVVGPRPERPYFVKQFKKSVPKYDDRHKVKCGITGWSQVNNLRGDVSIEERTKGDLYYVENWSFFLDIKIILRTVFEFLFHKNAY